MLAVGPCELTKNLLQELPKDMTMRWGMVLTSLKSFGLETSKTVAAILELQLGSKVLLKTLGIPCMRVRRSRTCMVWLSSGESELMGLVSGACESIATRDQWSKLCKCSPGTIVLCTDSSAALGFVKRKGASRRTRHVDTKVYFMHSWAMELGQRILKVHGDSQEVADRLTKITTPRAAHRKALGL